MSITRYGIVFPDGVSDVAIELHCYRWGKASAGDDYVPVAGYEKWQFLYRAIKMLWPEKLPDGKKGYLEHDWTIPRIKAWCALGAPGMTHDIWWGPSSTAKTTDAAVILLADWLSAPDRTCTHLVSTGIDALKSRIFGEIAKFHGMHGGNLPGTVKMSQAPCLTLGDENTKNGIFGHAVNQGNQLQSMNKLIGIHNEFNRLVIDEMQGSLPAASDAAVNLASGREFKFLGMGNPQSHLDPLGRHSKPIGGWDKINPTMESWRTDYGTVHFWDGRKSPGIADPKKYFFLLTQQMIDDTIRIYGVNSFQYWSQRIGWIPPEGLIPTVLSESFIEKYKMQKKAVWKDSFKVAAGFDPAYSNGGDRAMFYPFQYGIMDDDRFGICFLDAVSIELGSVGDKLMSQHITDQLDIQLKSHGITTADVAMDCTGMQGALADFIEDKLGRGILRVLFGGKASELPVESGSNIIGTSQYKNRVTELWYSMNYFGRNGHIRGLSDKSAMEFSQRRLDETGTPMCIESKKDYKLRTAGESPDESDAAAVGLEFVRVRLNKLPLSEKVGGETRSNWDALARENDIDSDPSNYDSADL